MTRVGSQRHNKNKLVKVITCQAYSISRYKDINFKLLKYHAL
jgi:hypothetical protein